MRDSLGQTINQTGKMRQPRSPAGVWFCCYDRQRKSVFQRALRPRFRYGNDKAERQVSDEFTACREAQFMGVVMSLHGRLPTDAILHPLTAFRSVAVGQARELTRPAEWPLSAGRPRSTLALEKNLQRLLLTSYLLLPMDPQHRAPRRLFFGAGDAD